MRRQLSRMASMVPITAIAMMLIAPVHVLAQTQDQQDRLNLVAKYVVTAPMCERLGMVLAPDLPARAEARLDAEMASWVINSHLRERLKNEAVGRQGKMLGIDLGKTATEAKTDAQLRNLKAVLSGFGHTCMAASTDPIFQSLIVPPANYDLDKAAIYAADAVLEAGGLASWQTPQIQARGDLMMVAGACRSKIGATRSDALLDEYGHSDDPRVRGYYMKSFDAGLSDPTLISTLAGCKRAIASLLPKVR